MTESETPEGSKEEESLLQQAAKSKCVWMEFPQSCTRSSASQNNLLLKTKVYNIGYIVNISLTPKKYLNGDGKGFGNEMRG